MVIVSLLVSIIVGALYSALIIWIVGKLGWGLEVEGFGPAFKAAIVIAVLTGLVSWGWSLLGYDPGTGWVAAIIHIVVAAAILMSAGSWVQGLKVNGFVGALIAGFAMGLIRFLIGLLLGGLGMMLV